MGRENECRVRYNGSWAVAKAHLDSEAIHLSGGVKARIPFACLTKIEAIGSELHLDDTILELGADAERWRKKILNPPTLLDKLGIKAGMSVALLGFSDRAFMKDHEFETCLVNGKTYDAILFHADALNDLRGLQKIKSALGPKSMLWIVYPKGRRDITQNHVFAHGKGIGMVDVKVCKFDETYTALKFLRRKS